MKQLIPLLFILGAVMVLVGAATYITGWSYSPYIYTIGATCVAFAQLNSFTKSNNRTLKRLRVQQIFGGVILLLAGAFMFTTKGNEWIACLAVGAILQLYTAFRIPQEEARK